MICGWVDIILNFLYKSIGVGVGLVSAVRLGHLWWCRIGEFTAARVLLVVSDNLYVSAKGLFIKDYGWVDII